MEFLPDMELTCSQVEISEYNLITGRSLSEKDEYPTFSLTLGKQKQSC